MSGLSRSRSTPKKRGIKSPSVLYVKQNHARFNAPSKRESIFFDECNREIISLTNDPTDSKTSVVFQQTEELTRIELVLPVGKKILSIKFNQDKSVIAYHVERNVIEFINVKDRMPQTAASSSGGVSSRPVETLKYVLEDRRYAQSCATKNSKLIGFLWNEANGVVFITDLSVEYYYVDKTRRRLSKMRVFQSATNWFVYQPAITNASPEGSTSTELGEDVDVNRQSRGRDLLNSYSLLVVSTGSLGNSLQPYMFSAGQVTRLQKFDVEGDWQGGDKLELFERSITIGYIYSFVRLLVLQHESFNTRSKGAQIALYTVDVESGLTSKTHTLDLDTTGRFAINIHDNLIIAHNQPSKSSLIFDIAIESTEKSDNPSHFVSLIGARPIRQLEISESMGQNHSDLYSLNWVFFQPNYIVDAKLGMVSTLQLDLQEMRNVIMDNILLLKFFSLREDSEAIILDLCREIVNDSYQLVRSTNSGQSNPSANPLADVSAAFEILGSLVQSAPELPSESSKSISETRVHKSEKNYPSKATIDQVDVEREIFRKLVESTDLIRPASFHFVTSVLFEFILAVRFLNKKNVEFCIYEHLVKCLARGKRYFHIIQLIRSEILKDSKQLACLLISLKEQYRPAGQLGIDMFNRLPGGPPPIDFTM